MIQHALPTSARFPSLFVGLALAVCAPLSLHGQESEDVEWSVDTELGPSKALRFTTTEGTWMNVDLSPDGGTLVFDLLGDIYTMPAAGGRATRIVGSQSLDIQPRFSPDGSSIAFVSDRDGAQNVWLVDPDGTDPRQVTEEANREVNSPAWSPDGEYIYVRKHFVDTRSLGAGEVWMYHRSGGSGLQVTERLSWQKDQGEPAPSSDGAWLYYSQDATPGTQFQYNKDPYAGIYAVRRRNLETGDEETVTGGPGGAITPRPSPDGTLLAFIRRDRLETQLWLRELATGREWPLWGGLERDMQEAWAIHGVYAQYDWLPDGSGLVIWAQGGLWRVDAATGDATRIPFEAGVDQTIHEGLRYTVDVAPETFRPKMLRHVATSPDGGSVVYDALGHLYLKELDGGDARRVTGDDARFEFDPAFSPDGRRIAYTTWSDEEGGRVRVVGVNGRGARVVVSQRGHYIEPSWSPDGEWIVYRSVGGDYIRGPTHGENTGIFIVPADGSVPPRKVRDGGTDPMFDHTGERVYVMSFGGGQRQLVSTDLDGGDEIVHLQSENADQIVPSPDGQWVAFTERYRAYVARFPRTGRTVALSPGNRAYPTARISRDAGLYLHWGGDGSSVHWSLGPEYYTRDLTESFTWLQAGEAAVDEPAEPESEGVDISFTMQSDAPEGTVVFTNARIITMAGQGWSAPEGFSGGEGDGAAGALGGAASNSTSNSSSSSMSAVQETPGLIESGTLVVTGNRITAVGAAGTVEVPRDAHVVDASGKTIIPGIIDVHAHVGGEGSGILGQTSWPLLANLAFGVTTSHDPSNGTETVFSNIELIRAGMKLGPRLFSTGTILYGAETPFKAVVEDLEDAEAHIRRMKAVGAFSVKSYNQRRRNARQWIIQAARDQEMMVVPEGGSLLFNNITMVHDGHTGVEHSLPVPNVYDDVARLFGESTTGYTPTLIVGYGGLSGEFYWYERTNVWEDEHLLAFTPRRQVDARSRRRLKAAGDDDFNHIAIARGAGAITDAGGLVLLGAHGQLQGLGAHWELWMFGQGGYAPMEALAVATINGARYLGLDRDLGSLEPGKLADLVVLNSNPLDDLHNTTDIQLVMVNGRLYDARTLAGVGNQQTPAPVPYWRR